MADAQPIPQRTMLFLGAGASRDADVPTTIDFVSSFAEFLRKRRAVDSPAERRVFRRICERIERWAALPGNEGKQLDVESVLEVLALCREGQRASHTSLGSIQNPLTAEDTRTAVWLEWLLKDFIRTRCLVDPELTNYVRPLLRFIADERPIHIFTVNYDIVVEQFLRKNGKSWTDGFELEWTPTRFDDSRFDVKIYKLHGSAEWFSTPFGAVLKIPVKGQLKEVTLTSGEIAESLMLYPTQKFLYTPTFLELFRRFQAALGEATWVVAAGYSFRDEQITRCFTEAASRNTGLHVVLVGPRAREVYRTQLETVTAAADRVIAGNPAQKVKSPLAGRVAWFPFKYGAVLPSLFTEILPGLRNALAIEMGARSAEIYGPTNGWQEAARAYLRVGFLDKATEFEQHKFELGALDEWWALGYLFERSLVEAAWGKLRESGETWSQAGRILRRLIVERSRIDFAFNGTETRVRFLYGVRTDNFGRLLSASGIDALRKVVDEALVVASRVRRFPDSKRSIGALTRYSELLEMIQHDLITPTTAMNDAGFAEYSLARPLTTRRALARIESEIESLRSTQPYDVDLSERLKLELTKVERGFLAHRPYLPRG